MRRVRFAGAITAASILTAAQLYEPPVAGQTYSPTARVCAIRDFNPTVFDPVAPLQIGAIVPGGDGFFYSTSPQGGKSTTTANQGTIFRFSPSASKFEVMYSFDSVLHGGTPMSGLVKSNDGYLYGTTYAGGTFPVNAQGAAKFGNGTIFRIKPGSTLPEVVHTFRYGDLSGIKPEVCPPKLPCRYSPQQRMNAAGGIPLSAPILASDGNLYGVTSGAIGFGTLGILYKVAPYNGESAITGLCIGGPMPPAEAQPTDQQLRDQCMFNGKFGNLPLGLTAGPNNDLYGTTIQVGNGSFGTVFKVNLPSGQITTLYNFTDPKNGSTPYGVILASDGYLYGVTKFGGPFYGAGNAGAGLVYRISPSGSNFQIVHAFNGTTEGSMPVAGLVEAKSPDGFDYLYGSTTGGGNLRGVLFRILLNPNGPTQPGMPFPYQVLQAFPGQWNVTGSFPASTILSANDPDLGLTFYGTTWSGGANDSGVLFQLSGVDLPTMQNLSVLPTYSFRSGYQRFASQITIPGQSVPAIIEAYTGAVAQQGTTPPANTLSDDGFMIKTSGCRSPHIVQFIYREKIGADGVSLAGSYSLSNGQSYQLTTNPANPVWHTDSSGVPNAYYDQQHGVPVIGTPVGLTFFDQPSFVAPVYLPGAHETWRATFKDYVICNCQAVAEVKWAREARWIVNLPSGNNVTVDVNQGHQDPLQYVNVSIGPPDDPQLLWVNQQVKKDGFVPVP